MIKYLGTIQELTDNGFKYVGDFYYKRVKDTNLSVSIDMWANMNATATKIPKYIVITDSGIEDSDKYAMLSDVKIVCLDLYDLFEDVIESIEFPKNIDPICLELINDIANKKVSGKELELNIRYLMNKGLSQKCIDHQVKLLGDKS